MHGTAVEIPKVVLTGGPCAGKSAFLSQARERLGRAGYMALLVPEVATEMFANGIFDADGFSHDDFEELAVRKQLFDEDFYMMAACKRACLGKQVVLCDRGLADARCYASDKGRFDSFIAGMGYDYAGLLADYDLVIHMRTAAAGDGRHYMADENPVRREKSRAAAMEADACTLAEWNGHPNLVVVENEGAFDDKLSNVEGKLLDFLREYYR